MSIKFKVGDRVRVVNVLDAHLDTSREDRRAADGYIYTIAEVDNTIPYPQVVLDVLDGWDTPITTTGKGWWVTSSRLKKVILKNKLGGEIL